MNVRPLALCVLVSAIGATAAHSQSVPIVVMGLEVGAGATSSHSGQTWFLPSHVKIVTADAEIRVGGEGRTRAVVAAAYSGNPLPEDHVDSCVPSPGGGCKANFPNIEGPSVGIGLRHVLGTSALVGLTAGIAFYDTQARFAELSAAWRFSSHVGLVAKYSYIDMPVSGQRAWFMPLSGGLQIVW